MMFNTSVHTQYVVGPRMDTSPGNKALESAAITADIDLFLAMGGTIEVIPPGVSGSKKTTDWGERNQVPKGERETQSKKRQAAFRMGRGTSRPVEELEAEEA